MFKYTLVVMLAAMFGNGTAFAQENRGTPEQRAACAPDAFRLCLSYIPDATNVEACLRQRKSDLSDACRAGLRSRCGCFGQDNRIVPLPWRERWGMIA
jgi:hypothetical protein